MTIVCQHETFVNKYGRVRQGYYLDDTLVPNLEFLQDMVKNKWDGVGLITGMVGVGKTTISHAIAHFLDPTFNLDRIVFSGEELMRQIDMASIGQVICFDEAVLSMSSQDFATELQKVLIKKFTLIRSKRLYILLIIPSFYMMRKWFSVERTKFMIHVYSPDGLSRGYFKFYSWNRKKELYLRGYKYMDMNCVSANFKGRFTDTEGFFIDPVLYEEKKQLAVKKLTESSEKTDKQKLTELFRDRLLKIEIDNKQWKEKQKEKFQIKYQEWRQKFADLKKKYESNLGTIESEAIDLQKSRDKVRVQELERDYAKLVYFSYNKISEYWRYKTGQEFETSLFTKMLNEEKVINKDWSYLKKYYQSGEQLAKLSV